MPIEQKLRLLRTTVRKQSKVVIDKLVADYIHAEQGLPLIRSVTKSCIFCGASENVTKEHVLPRWTFEGSTKKFFVTDVNGMSQTYIRTTVPACQVCNAELLNSLERHMQDLFAKVDLSSDSFFYGELECIIQWLEIIDYKFQVLNSMRRFKASKEHGFIKYLSTFPITMLRRDGLDSREVITEIRRSHKRITMKSKKKRINSLQIFRTKNTNFHFIHTMDDFIFIELPQFKKAFLYFFRKEFLTHEAGQEGAQELLDQVYN